MVRSPPIRAPGNAHRRWSARSRYTPSTIAARAARLPDRGGLARAIGRSGARVDRRTTAPVATPCPLKLERKACGVPPMRVTRSARSRPTQFGAANNVPRAELCLRACLSRDARLGWRRRMGHGAHFDLAHRSSCLDCLPIAQLSRMRRSRNQPRPAAPRSCRWANQAAVSPDTGSDSGRYRW